MIRQLLSIKQQIDKLLNNPDPTVPETKWKHFDQQLTHIETEVYTIFKNNPDRVAVWDAQNFHADLVQLINQHTLSSPDASLTPMLARLLETLQFCEQKFQVPIDLKISVPLVYERQLHDELRRLEGTIVPALIEKQVNSILIDKITHGFHLICSQPTGTLNYATYRYLQQFLPVLTELSQSTLLKDWNLRLFRFFIQYNYNHMGVYNWWERTTVQALQGKSATEALELIYQLVNDIEHIDQQTHLGYQTWRKPLKAQLLAYLERRKELLTDKKLLQEAQEACTLIVNIPVDEHNVHFNRDFEAGMYAAYASKKEASEVYASVIRGPDGVRLSAHSLRKSDKIKFYSAADRVEEWLSEKREAIVKQFGLLLSSRRGK